MWGAFHKLRNSEEIRWGWGTFVAAIKVPEQCKVESQFALQMLMDRILKKMLENKANATAQHVTNNKAVAPLSM